MPIGLPIQPRNLPSLGRAIIPGDTLLVSPDGLVLNQATPAEMLASCVKVNASVINVLGLTPPADPTGATDSTAVFAAAVAALPSAGGVIKIPAGNYIGSLHIYRNNVVVVGDGSAVTKVTNPVAGTWSAMPAGGVLEIGQAALGNSAPNVDGFGVFGITVDGNRSAQPTATDDIHGWGIICTFATHGYMSDVKAQNCQVGGCVLALNSNYWKGSITVENCGNTAITAPGFDVNASKFLNLDVISNGCLDGVRILQNSYGINMRATINNATQNGFIYSNIPPPTAPSPPSYTGIHASFANNIDIAVIGGCTFQGVVIQNFPNNSNARISVQGVSGAGVNVFYNGTLAQNAHGCVFDINTYQCALQGVLINSTRCVYRIVSEDDGWSAAVDTVALVDNQPQSSGNKIDATIIKNNGNHQFIGFANRSGSTDNEVSVRITGTQTSVNGFFEANTAATCTNRRLSAGSGGSLASISPLNIPLNGDAFTITGVTTLSIVSDLSGTPGRIITLLFPTGLTVDDVSAGGGSNVYLAGHANQVFTANSTLSLRGDGINWYEISRSVH